VEGDGLEMVTETREDRRDTAMETTKKKKAGVTKQKEKVSDTEGNGLEMVTNTGRIGGTLRRRRQKRKKLCVGVTSDVAKGDKKTPKGKNTTGKGKEAAKKEVISNGVKCA
jgi:hypothetical protein